MFLFASIITLHFLDFQEINVVVSTPTRLATIAQATSDIKESTTCCISPKPVVKPIAPNPIIIPSIVPTNPRYNGIGVTDSISASTASQFRSTISFIRLKSLTAPLFFIRYVLIDFSISFATSFSLLMITT